MGNSIYVSFAYILIFLNKTMSERLLCGVLRGGAEPVGGPEAQGDLADKVFVRDGAEEAGVVGVSAVIAHHKDVVFGYEDGAEGVEGGRLLGGARLCAE